MKAVASALWRARFALLCTAAAMGAALGSYFPLFQMLGVQP